MKVSFFFSSRRRHTRSLCDWSSDVCSSDLLGLRESRHDLDERGQILDLLLTEPAAEGGHAQVSAFALLAPGRALAPRRGRAVADPLADLPGGARVHHDLALPGRHGALVASGIGGAACALGSVAG